MNALQLQMNDIPVPEDLDSYIKKSMKKYAVRKINKRVFICLTAVVTLFAALTITCYASPEAAKTLSKVPVIGSIIKNYYDKDLTAAQNNGLTQVPGMQQTVGDATITVTDLYCDQEDFIIGLTLKNVSSDQLDYQIYYQGKSVSTSWGGEVKHDKNGSCSTLLDTTLKTILPDKCNIQFKAHERSGLKRQFTFDLAVDNSLVNDQSKEVEINKTFTEGDRTLLIKNILFTPYATTVYFDYNRSNSGEDDVRLLDSDNNELEFKGVSYYSNNLEDKRFNGGVARFGSMKEIPDSLTFQIVKLSENDPAGPPAQILMSEEIQLDTK